MNTDKLCINTYFTTAVATAVSVFVVLAYYYVGTILKDAKKHGLKSWHCEVLFYLIIAAMLLCAMVVVCIY